MGRLYLAGKTDCVDVVVAVSEDGGLTLQGEGVWLCYAGRHFEIEPRLAALPRVISFADGARFEGEHTATIADLEARHGTHRFAWVDHLERRWSTVIGAGLAVALIVFLFFTQGIPAAASAGAKYVPAEWRESASEESLEAMLEYEMISETSLDEEEVAFSEAAFQRALRLAGVADSEAFTYEIRHYWMGGVPNAFAFPSGTIVGTDYLVRMCETEEQLMAVYLHEIAHVEKLHGVRSVLQQAGVLVIATTIFGDVSSIANLGAALPSILVDSSYSKGFEVEADLYAAEILRREGIGAGPMKEALVMLHEEGYEVGEIEALLSSHPSLAQRVAAIEAAEESDAGEE